MIAEDYVSFETAKLLKEKGFDEPCVWAYDPNGASFAKSYHEPKNSELNEYEYSKPTLQMVMKWLRKVHNKYCDIGYDINLEWFFQIVDLKETVEYDYLETKYYHAENEIEFKTYEEAAEAAIKYCLENLV